MHIHRPRFGPLGAFALTLAAAGVYFACVGVLVAASGYELPAGPGYTLFVCAPVVLCGLVYAVNAHDESAVAVQWFRVAAASILAPMMAGAVFVTIGFTQLGWSM